MLLGRSAEQRRLHQLLTAARSGESGALIITGDPGVGKTTLLEDAVGGIDDVLVLRTRGTESEAELPFAGIADVLRPITGRLAELPAPQAAALGGALGLSPRVPGDPFTTFLGAFNLLALAAEEQPVVLVVDDAHWLDESSNDAIVFIARRLAAEGICILLAMRGELPTRFKAAGVPVLALAGLGPDDGAKLARQLVASPTSDEVVRRLVTITRGNPMALQQLSTLLTPGQLSGDEDLPDPLPVGPELRGLLLQRLEGLPADTRRALVLASASGHGEEGNIGRALESIGLAVSALEPAEVAGVISLGPTYRFTHPLVRAALYHDAEPAERRRAHQTLADVVSGADASVRRAWHLAAAALGTDESVAAALEAAGDEARARGAHAVAATTYGRASELSTTPRARVPRVLAAAVELVVAGQPGRALPLLDDALDQTADALERAEIEHLRGRVLMNVGPLRQAQDGLAVAAHAVEELAPTKAASMLSDAALASFISGQIQIGEGYGRRAMALTGGRDDGPGEINHILFTGMLVLSGKSAEAAVHVDRERRRIQAMRAADEWQFIALSAIWLMWAEELDLAQTVLDGAVSEARRLGGVGLLPLPLAQRAELAWRSGDGSVAYTLSAEAVKLAEDTGQAVTLAYALAVQTLVLAGQGRQQECRASAAAALAAAHPVGGDSTISRVEAALGLLELGAGRHAEAVRHLQTAHELMQAQGVREPTVVPYVADYIEALLRVGRVAQAEDLIDYILSAQDGPPRLWTRAVLARSRGLLAADEEFAEHFDEALGRHAELPGRFDRGRTLLAYGERLRRSGQRLLARERLRAALHDFERVGAAAWATRARAELRAAGEAITEIQASDLGLLTPQELQISLAVANGLTNREVAASLFLSPKTVEFHLGNVYSKLALRSRTDLVRLIAAQA